MKKRLLAIFLCVMLCVSIVPFTAFAVSSRDTSFELTLASELKGLGLFKGVSDTDFDLNRAPSRTEALVMLIRVLGKETEAVNGRWADPFTDVAAWADKYVGYAYANNLTNGVSSTQFGSGTASAATYLTFVLRVLGYSDANGADFTWSDPYSLAKSIGIMPSCVHTDAFWRSDVVVVSYAALSVPLKGTTQTLAQKLISAGVFTQAQFDTYYDSSAISSHESASTDPKAELSAEEIYAQCSPAVFYLEVYDATGTATASGSGFFIDSQGTAVTNYHVIDGAYSAKITVSDTGKIYDVLGVYGYDIFEDWAVLKIGGTGFSYLDIGAPATVVGGATVYAIGSPLGLQNSISQGLISNTSRPVDDVNYIQTSAAISSGSSGGALLNKYGDVIGITSASYIDGQNLNLALPISIISGFDASNPAELSKITAQIEAGHQLAAFLVLRNWILDNYNDTVSGCKTYQETYSDSTGKSIYALIYDEENDSIIFSLVNYSNSGEFYSFLTLHRSSQNCTSTFSYYNSANNTDHPTFRGFGYVYAPTFNEDASYTFSGYEGDTSNLSSYQKTAKYMYLDSLNFANYIFYTYLLDYGYSMADFGFTSLSD
ncbi:MAG: S1C family serine protease [Clostridiaceae bacterium]|nr:S1C family serine protease [Clostridiaceae bacterium]